MTLGRPADTIVFGGPIRTMDPRLPVTDAVAVTDGVITAVGREEVGSAGSPRTEVVDLDGRTLLPGFQDAHLHPLDGGLQQLECDLSELHSLDGYRLAIRAFADAHPDDEWVRGAAWYGDVFPGGFPDRRELDALTGGRPAVFACHDGHGVWVSSAALERAGIDRDTPDPDGGRIQRDAAGEATGVLMESAADLVTDLLPEPDEAHLERALLQAQSYLHRLGITAWQDAAVGDAIGIPDSFDLYCRLSERGSLTARVTGALWWDRDAGFDQVPELVRRRGAVPEGRFRASAIKIMQDGVCENLTAALLRPYRGHGDERGMSFIEPAELARIACELDRLRFDLHLHAVGDRAVRECLDALAGLERGAWDSRHQIAHLDLIDPADVSRMGRLGVIANIQPLWARLDPVLVETKLPYLDEVHQQNHFAFGSLQRAGAQLAMGSDWPVSSPDPLWGIHVAVNRTAPEADPHAQDERAQTEPLLPGEAIDLDSALAAYTRHAARANRLDATGTLTTGFAADLVVLDRDPFATPPRELSSIRVQQTFVAGESVYEAR